MGRGDTEKGGASIVVYPASFPLDLPFGNRSPIWVEDGQGGEGAKGGDNGQFPLLQYCTVALIRLRRINDGTWRQSPHIANYQCW